MPQIIIEETPASILSRAGSQVWGAREDMKEAARRQTAFELDKQRAEFELATARQEQARKIESEQAFRDGVAFTIKNAQGFDSPLQQQARAIGAVQVDPNTPGYRGKGAFQIRTKAQEEYAAHEQRMAEESAALAAYMEPKLAQIHLENERQRSLASRVDFERNQTLADLTQWFKNDPNAQADEAMAAGFQQVVQNLQQADAFDETLPRAIDEARGFMAKAIEIGAENDAIGEFKAATDQEAVAAIQEMTARGSLDKDGVSKALRAINLFRRIPVTSQEDATRQAYALEDEIDQARSESKARTRSAAVRDKAAKDPVQAGVLWDESVAEARQQVLREYSAGLSKIPEGDPNAAALLEREVFGRAAGIFQDRGGPRGFVEQKGRAMFTPEVGPLDRMKRQHVENVKGVRAKGAQELAKLPGISGVKDPGKKARIYRFLAELKIQGASDQEAEAALAEKFKMKIDDLDMSEVQRHVDMLKSETQGRPRERIRGVEAAR